MKRWRRILLLVAALVLAYLALAGAWAWMVFDAARAAMLAATSEEEFTRLVAMIKAPNRYHPLRDPGALAQRSARIQALLAGRCAPSGWFDTEFADCAP